MPRREAFEAFELTARHSVRHSRKMLGFFVQKRQWDKNNDKAKIMPRREAFEAPEAPSEALSEALPKNSPEK